MRGNRSRLEGISPPGICASPKSIGVPPKPIGAFPKPMAFLHKPIRDAPIGSGESPLSVGDAPIGSGFTPKSFAGLAKGSREAAMSSGETPMSRGQLPNSFGTIPKLRGETAMRFGVAAKLLAETPNASGVRGIASAQPGFLLGTESASTPWCPVKPELAGGHAVPGSAGILAGTSGKIGGTPTLFVPPGGKRPGLRASFLEKAGRDASAPREEKQLGNLRLTTY